ncbi:hypothetical protein ACROYT_G018024 [Oculina patagonica]
MSMADCLQEAPEEWAEFCDSTKKTSLNLTVTDLEDQIIKTLQPGESYQAQSNVKNTKLQLVREFCALKNDELHSQAAKRQPHPNKKYLEQHPPSEPLRRYTPIPVNQPMPEYVGCCNATCSFSCRTIQEMQAHQTDAKHPGFMMHVMSTPQTGCALHAESNSVSGAICTNTRLPWRGKPHADWPGSSKLSACSPKKPEDILAEARDMHHVGLSQSSIRPQIDLVISRGSGDSRHWRYDERSDSTLV